jgi:glycosyltransferase involved in cell wall biosynthesis
MRVLFLCGREVDYPRNQILLRALENLSEVELIAEHGVKSSIILRSIRVLLRAFPKILLKKYDLIFIGFYGYLLVPFTRWSRQTPVIFDAFVSNYDTFIFDRQIAKQSSLLAKIAFNLDRYGCHNADTILLDTHAHAKYFSETLGIPAKKIKVLPVGAVDALFFPRPTLKQNEKINVLYYCTYLPLHGIPIVVEAAHLLQNEDIQFTLVGTGPEFPKAKEIINRLALTNIQLLPDVPLSIIADKVAHADICLGGHFGNSSKAGRTIPGKIYQILAAGKPVIATDTEANQELLTHLENAYLCSIADSQALARAIMVLSKDETLRKKIGENGRRTYLEKCSEVAIEGMVKQILETTINLNR